MCIMLQIINADKDVETLHNELFEYSVAVIDHAKYTKLENLW